MNEFKNLILALENFGEDWSYSGNNGHLDLLNDIAFDRINLNQLKNEYQFAIKNNDFDWPALAKSSFLLINSDIYTGLQIKDYVKMILNDFLIPNEITSIEFKEKLLIDMTLILKQYNLNNGWMSTHDLFHELKKLSFYKNLEYYNMFKLPEGARIRTKGITNSDFIALYIKYFYNE